MTREPAGSETRLEPPLPPPLSSMESEAAAFGALRRDIERTEQRWRDQVEHIRRSVPGVIIEDGGETVRAGEISPGCRACKSGKWDCVFTTMTCNLACSFCISPHRPGRNSAWSALGRDAAEARRAYERCGVVGASFSGGEPFLHPSRVLEGVTALRRDFPDLYLWAYTNGLPLTDRLLADLAKAGLDELRFNLAATGYADPHVSRMLKRAVELLPFVAVEIPALPGDEPAVLAALSSWADTGVTYLNLHELVYEPESPSETMPGDRVPCTMPDGHRCEFDPRSGDFAVNVLERTIQEGIPLAVNYCSLLGKAAQIRGRRRMMATYTLRPHEALCADGTAESVCIFDRSRIEYVHPSAAADRQSCAPDRRAAVVRRLLPLGPDQPDQWVHFQVEP